MKNRIISAVLILCLMLSVSACGNSTGKTVETVDTAAEEKILGQTAGEGLKYTLYIGLNDKDTYEQLISTEDAIEKANQIVARHSGGYTQMTARGGWTNDDGSMGHENTMVYIIYDIDEASLKAMLDELLKEFNQSSILVEKEDIPHIYYSNG